MKISKKSGYIIPLTLLIVSLAVVLITAIVRESFSYQRQVRLAHDRARARLLVLSSLELMLSQVSFVVPKEKGAEGEKKGEQREKAPDKGAKDVPEAKKDEVSEPLQQWMLKLLPLLNRWHTVELAPGGDPIEGTISYYIACEQGKISLDTLLKDLKKQGKQTAEDEKAAEQAAAGQAPGQPGASGQSAGKPTPGQSPTGQSPTAPPGQSASNQPGAPKKEEEKPGQAQKRSLITVVDELFKKEKEISIREALKNVDTAPEDPTDLLKVSQFAKLRDGVFVSQEMPKKPLFLMDLFTVQEDATKLNPWLLSQSVKTLLDLKENKEVKIDKNFVKNIKPKSNWVQDWDKGLAKLYGKKFAALEKPIADLFSSEFEATAFSVVSYCKVGMVTQRIGALLELTEPSPEVSPKSFIFKVTKLYWL